MTLVKKFNHILKVGFELLKKSIPEPNLHLSEKEIQMREIQKQADELLDHNAYEVLFEMVEHGYQLTDSQNDKLSEVFIKHIDDKAMNLAGNMIAKGYTMNDKAMNHIFFHTSFMIYCRENLTKGKKYEREHYKNSPGSNFSYICEEIQERIKQPYHQQVLLKQWLTICQKIADKTDRHYYSEYEFREPFIILHKEWFKDLDIKEYKKIINDFKKVEEGAADKNTSLCRSVGEIIQIMNDSCAHILKRTSRDLIEKTKQVYMEEKVTNIIVHAQKEHTKNINMKNLPAAAQRIVEEIEGHYSKIQANGDKLQKEQNFTVNNLMEQRLPEILRKYFSIDDEYRTSLKNHEGKYAGDLLLESLAKVNVILKDIVVGINEDKLTNLTVTNRYMDSLVPEGANVEVRHMNSSKDSVKTSKKSSSNNSLYKNNNDDMSFSQKEYLMDDIKEQLESFKVKQIKTKL